jgi:hypothetical protein
MKMTIFIQFLFILILVSGSGATAYVPHALLVVSDAAKKVNDRKRHPSEPTPR